MPSSYVSGLSLLLVLMSLAPAVSMPGGSLLFSALAVADDILDCTQTSEQLGKTAGKVSDASLFMVETH